jgi:hypothetical protein
MSEATKAIINYWNTHGKKEMAHDVKAMVAKHPDIPEYVLEAMRLVVCCSAELQCEFEEDQADELGRLVQAQMDMLAWLYGHEGTKWVRADVNK